MHCHRRRNVLKSGWGGGADGATINVSAIPIFLQFFLPSFCYHISDIFATLYFVNLVSGRLKACRGRHERLSAVGPAVRLGLVGFD